MVAVNVNLPDPKDYTDGLQFFRDTHNVVLHNCAELSRMLDDAEALGVFQSFASHAEWESLFRFFTVDAPRHERDEEEFLFPAIAARVPHVGFQQPDSPIRFLIEGHQILAQKEEALVRDWAAFRAMPRDAASLGSAHAAHTAEDANFISRGHELVRLYREHIATEEQRVYAVAEKVLSGEAKLELADQLRDVYDNEAISSLIRFDEPQFSDPHYNAQFIPTEAVGDNTFDTEEDENEEEDNILL
jgi:hemerythrin-like domain-containing protein